MGNTAGASGVVLCLGDSLTRGIKETGFSYPSELEGLLRSAGHNFRVVNAGNWGDTCGKLTARLKEAVANAVLEGSLAFVLVLGGTNDILQGTSAAQVLTQLQQLQAAAGRAVFSPRVGVMTLPPLQKLPEPPRTAGARELARVELNRRLREALQQPAPKWSPEGRRFLVDLESVDSMLTTSDGVHYMEEGYSEFARRACEAMCAVLAEQPKLVVVR